ncbi:MBL fold metallo-hydrolase [soil metagenome]
MLLTVLGGSSAGPNTRQGCSGYLVESGKTRVVLDLGPGTLPELRAHAEFRALDAVILSHLHIDHCLDLFPLYWGLSTNPVRPARPTPVWLPPDGIIFVRDVAAALAGDALADNPLDDVLTLHEFEPDEPLEIGDLRLTFHPTIHYVSCWGIRVEDGAGRVLAYTADTDPGADLSDLVRSAQAIVAEAMLVDSDGFRGSSTAAEAAQLARDAGAETLILTHISEEIGSEPPAARPNPSSLAGWRSPCPACRSSGDGRHRRDEQIKTGPALPIPSSG